VITTPNIEYNEIYGISRFRHGDHRFEWNRTQFQSWAKETARRYGYRVSFEDIGEADEKLGPPTQMGIFVREGRSPEISRRFSAPIFSGDLCRTMKRIKAPQAPPLTVYFSIIGAVSKSGNPKDWNFKQQSYGFEKISPLSFYDRPIMLYCTS
jgi:hypothetical protein